MPNRIELQEKGKGLSKNPTTGKPQGPGTTHKGIAREIRAAKRTEAEIRNADTVQDKRRSFWKERGFTRQSQAASLIKGVVVLTNQQAKIHKQRSEDWPLVKDQLAEHYRQTESSMALGSTGGKQWEILSSLEAL